MIKHLAICEHCRSTVDAIPPQAFVTDNWNTPPDWKRYEGKDFCTPKCVVDYIIDLETEKIVDIAIKESPRLTMDRE